MKIKFIILDSVFYSNKKNEALFYNVETKKSFLVHKGHSSIRKFLDSLMWQKLYTAVYSDDDISVNKLVCELVDIGMGRLAPIDAKDCSIPLIPIMNNDLSFESSHSELEISLNNRNLIFYLEQITFYIGGETLDHNDLSSQISYPVRSDSRLPFSSIRSMIRECERLRSHCKYEIVLSDLMDSDILSFAEDMLMQKDDITFVLLYDKKQFGLICTLSNIGYKVIQILDSEVGYNLDLMPQVEYRLVIRNEQDLKALGMLKSKGICVHPELVYDDNLSFLKDAVFLKEQDFENIVCSKKDLFIHQKINISYWGRFFVFPDGLVYASPLKIAKIGTISDSILSLISRELTENTSWRQVRGNNNKCCDCVYQWICPSPTPMEQIISPITICDKM